MTVTPVVQHVFFGTNFSELLMFERIYRTNLKLNNAHCQIVGFTQRI